MRSRHAGAPWAQGGTAAFSPREGDSPFLDIREESPPGHPTDGANRWRAAAYDEGSPNLSITLDPTGAHEHQLHRAKHHETLVMDASPILLTIASENSSPPSEYVVGRAVGNRGGASAERGEDVTIESIVEMGQRRPDFSKGAKDEHVTSQRSPSSQTIGGMSKSSSRTPAQSVSPERPPQAKRMYSVPPQLLLRGGGGESNRLPQPQFASHTSSPRDDSEHLRKTLILSQARARVLEEELQRAKEALNNTSVNVTVRETECVELNGLVDSLQAEVAQLRDANARLRQQLSNSTNRYAAVDVQRSSSLISGQQQRDLEMEFEMKLAELEDALCEKRTEAHHWMVQHDAAIRELAMAKLRIAQQQAVLDRLDLHPPYPDELIGSARLKKNLFVAL